MSDLRIRPHGVGLPFYTEVYLPITSDVEALAKRAWTRKDDMAVFTDLLLEKGVTLPVAEKDLEHGGSRYGWGAVNTYHSVPDAAMYQLEASAREWIVDKLLINCELRVTGTWPGVLFVLVKTGTFHRVGSAKVRSLFGSRATVTQKRLLVAEARVET